MDCSWVRDHLRDSHFIKDTGGPSGAGEEQRDCRAWAVQEPLSTLPASLWEAETSGSPQIGLSWIIYLFFK